MGDPKYMLNIKGAKSQALPWSWRCSTIVNMEPITRGTFNKWANKNDWMQVFEGMTPQGRQVQFLTPAGEIVVIIIDLKGNIAGVGKVLPVPPSPTLPGSLGQRG